MHEIHEVFAFKVVNQTDNTSMNRRMVLRNLISYLLYFMDQKVLFRNDPNIDFFITSFIDTINNNLSVVIEL